MRLTAMGDQQALRPSPKPKLTPGEYILRWRAQAVSPKLHPSPLSCWITGPARLSCVCIRSRTLARPMAWISARRFGGKAANPLGFRLRGCALKSGIFQSIAFPFRFRRRQLPLSDAGGGRLPPRLRNPLTANNARTIHQHPRSHSQGLWYIRCANHGRGPKSGLLLNRTPVTNSRPPACGTLQAVPAVGKQASGKASSAGWKARRPTTAPNATTNERMRLDR